MKRKRFTEEQIIGVLKEAEAGAKALDLCRRYGISEQRGIHLTQLPATHGGHDERRVSKRAQARQTPPAEGACKTVCPCAATSGD